MKTRPSRLSLLHTSLACALALCLTGPAGASFSQVIAFGDSLSDNGNLYRLTSFLPTGGIPGEPYFSGRFSNGLLAVETMALELRTNLTSYAYAGAQTGLGNQGGVLLYGTGVTGQVDRYAQAVRSSAAKADAEALYFVWAGPNDFYTGQAMRSSDTATKAADNLLKVVETLYELGARQMLVPLMPDLSLTPSALASDASYRDLARARTQEFNSLLGAGLATLSARLPALATHVFDTPAFFASITDSLQAQGYNTTSACYNALSSSVCNNQGDYIFWDGVHPTAVTGRMLGEAFAAKVADPLSSTASAVPEASNWLTMGMGLGLLLAHWRWRLRRQAQSTALAPALGTPLSR